MIRIAHVITGLQQGGAEAALVRIAQGLAARGFRQSVISLTGRGFYAEQLEASGVAVQSLGMAGAWMLPGGVPPLIRRLAALAPDIVQTWLYHADMLGLLAARLGGGASIAWNVRCSSLQPGDVPNTTRALARMLAFLSAWPDAALFNSAAGLAAHRALGYRPRQTRVIPNGFDMAEWRPDPQRRQAFRTEIGASEGDLVVGMVGRHHRMKDHPSFLAAAARVRRVRRDVRFVLAGTDVTWGNRALAAEIDRLGLVDCVTLLGPRGDVPTLMAGFDCLALTSTSEGFPNVLGEAMASGVPCVSTDVGDAREIIGETGRIVPVGDTAGIADGILDIVGAPLEKRATMSAACRARIAENFEINGVVDRYASFYRELNERQAQRHISK